MKDKIYTITVSEEIMKAFLEATEKRKKRCEADDYGKDEKEKCQHPHTVDIYVEGFLAEQLQRIESDLLVADMEDMAGSGASFEELVNEYAIRDERLREKHKGLINRLLKHRGWDPLVETEDQQEQEQGQQTRGQGRGRDAIAIVRTAANA